MLYPGFFLTGTRTLSIPRIPLSSGTTAVSSGKGVIRSRRPQVRWCSRICLGAVRDCHLRISSNRAGCVGCKNDTEVFLIETRLYSHPADISPSTRQPMPSLIALLYLSVHVTIRKLSGLPFGNIRA